MFRIRCLRLLSPYVNAIILEIAWSFVCPDTCVRWFTPTVRTFSTRVYSPRPLRSTNAPTIYDCYDCYESLRFAPRLSVTSFELPRYTTNPKNASKYLCVPLYQTDPQPLYRSPKWPSNCITTAHTVGISPEECEWTKTYRGLSKKQSGTTNDAES